MRRSRFRHPLRKLLFNPLSGRSVDPVADTIEAIADAIPKIEVMDHVLFNEIKTHRSKVGDYLLPRSSFDAATFNQGSRQ